VKESPILETFIRQREVAAERRTRFGLNERKAALAGLRDVIVKREAEVVAALAADFAKPEPEVLLTEIGPVLAEIAHARANLRRWMRSRRVRPTLSTLGTSARIRPEPRGTCLIIAPWNYPFNLALSPLVSALAAGNSVIVKPSELAPATSALIASLVAEAFPPELVTVVEGDARTAQELLALPFDHIFFTGSPEVGRIVMAAAARTLASVTLELGGKSPTIVGPSADLSRAARWIAWGKFTNAGQTCIAPDHVLVHASVAERLRELLQAEIAHAYGPDAAARKTTADFARIVNDRHTSRLRELLAEAVGKGARIRAGGEADGRFIAPTLIDAVTPDMAIDQQEIFGPILPIITFDDLDTVIGRINGRPKPLALYVFDKDRDFVERVVGRTSSGGVGVNLTVLQFGHLNLPFGGVNNSGFGAAHGVHGFRTFSHEKPVLTDRWSVVPRLFPPYDAATRRLIGMLHRFLARGA
jgi:aldehyde dehydrogenase (NAD+)